MTYALSRKDHAYRDWITPFVELDNGILRSGDWVEFWLYLTDKSALPRQWSAVGPFLRSEFSEGYSRFAR